MRVASLAIDDYVNYGNNLQKYALHYTLKKFVDYTEVLWLEQNNFFSETGNFTYFQSPPPNNLDFMSSQIIYLWDAVRISKMVEFTKRFMKTRFDIPYIEDIGDEYDYFIVGSDQVWRPSWFLPKYFLDFAPNNKKIAYAASIANPEISDDKKEIFKAALMTFPKISVREEGAIKIIHELTGRDDVQLVLDPVMLLTQDEWLNVAKKPVWFDEKYSNGYVFTYYLSKEPPPEINRIAKKLGLPVVNLLDWKNYWHYITSPEEFIYLFANASLIYTNSFHGTAFSILFRKPFVNIGVNLENDMRLPSILKMFGMENRVATVENNFEIENLLAPDYSLRDKTLPTWREKSFKFLADALNLPMPKLNAAGGFIL